MKSIKEKAKEHGLEYPGIRYSHDDFYQDCDKPSMDFKAGANYVLEEIEKCYEKDDSLCVISHKIISKIQQLKGE